MIYMFLSNNPSSGDINSSNLSCFTLHVQFLGPSQKNDVINSDVHGSKHNLVTSGQQRFLFWNWHWHFQSVFSQISQAKKTFFGIIAIKHYFLIHKYLLGPWEMLNP